MKYDFDKVIDRACTDSCKFDDREAVFGKADVIPLWIADMDFEAAQPVREAVEKKAAEGIWGYTTGLQDYFRALCAWKKRRNGWDIDPEKCSYSPGVVMSLCALIKLFTPEGSRVLVQSPTYSHFYGAIEGLNREVLESFFVERGGQWEPDWADFEAKLRECDMFFLCSPQNPLGRVWAPEELRRMVELCHRYGVKLVSDEIHSDLIFRGKHTPTATVSDLAAETVITCVSGTKTFNLAGLYVSAVVFPDAKTKRSFDAFWRSLAVETPNAFGLAAMTAAFDKGDEWLDQLLEYIDGNFTYVKSFLDENIPQIKTFIPDATYLMWLDCRGLGLEDNDALRRFFIERAGLGLSEGRQFCPSLTGYMRLNVACPRATLEKAMTQLKRAVDELLSGK
ncbi:MAG: pyridoxal phosphate-dependent aminotransferase [Oscillospiraceae bacterium]|nr:pyridoxal phosphate-dependent aminotransferase [Oscillospiraceae bacterium]